MIGKVPRNYSNDFDRRKQHLNEIVEALNNITTVEANPDEQPTVDLENLKIGDTVYSVKNPELTSIKSFKLTMSNGGQYNTNKPIIEFFNEAGQEASITSSDYTVECDKTYAGNANMDQVCSIQTPDTPGTFTYTFVNDFDIEEYKLIKLTRGGTFVNDIAKNIKIELSADGENYITIYDETTITWSDAVPYHLISLKDGSEASTLLPIVTTSDNGKVLGVVGGNWDKMDVLTPQSYDSIPIIKADGSITHAYSTIQIFEYGTATPDTDGIYSGNWGVYLGGTNTKMNFTQVPESKITFLTVLTFSIKANIDNVAQTLRGIIPFGKSAFASINDIKNTLSLKGVTLSDGIDTYSMTDINIAIHSDNNTVLDVTYKLHKLT